ncbi:keratinocyte associated protein 2 (predicted), isoform CRA_b [Rattus norvegicus]|uniref:Keratinocyte associated protein 2 (Predicted), isoform CRA_b n=1 Tax=Rattus norvegicus TaxID=10116 RepID=A6J6D4_RAT|nr:keratinocyte associated protein 2 (predicted), isoform CRA_b [Rattus norvegicus]
MSAACLEVQLMTWVQKAGEQAGRWLRMLFGALFPPCRKRALHPRRVEEEVKQVHVGPDACVQTTGPALAPLFLQRHGLDPRTGRDGSRYRDLLGAVLPPVPAALRWHADIQPPVGLHRVAHHSGGPAGLRPFRLLPNCLQ